MKQNSNQRAMRPRKAAKPWIKYCAIGGVVLLVIALSLYLFRYMRLDREFHHNIKHFGEKTYNEIFSLTDTESEAEPILKLAEEAFSFVGEEIEAMEKFGLLSKYSCTDPKAVSEKHTIDYIISNIGDTKGYIWVAYTQSFLDPVGEAISAAGSDKVRILARWSVERQGSRWVVTEISEGT